MQLFSLSRKRNILGPFLFLMLVVFPPISLSSMTSLPPPAQIIPAPPALAAKSYLLIDYLSGRTLAEQGSEDRVEPASLTKMMTVYVVDHALKSGKLKLEDEIHVSEKAWKMEGSRMFVEVNTTVSVENLLKGIIIQSGNDASVALAEQVAGSESAFAELMNFYAKQLGMNNTHFANATGLPDANHYTTAKDMAILARALIRDFPNTYTLYSQKEYIYQDIKQENRNRLLWRNALVDGIKTGHTDSAGYCLVASGKKGDMRLIAVVMGTKNDAVRIEETNKLLTYGFSFFETKKLYSEGTSLKKSRIWMGQTNEVELGLKEDLYVTVGQGQFDALKTQFTLEPIIKAPAQAGESLGKLTVALNDKTIAEQPMVALTPIPEGGFISRMYDKVALHLHLLLDKSTQ